MANEISRPRLLKYALGRDVMARGVEAQRGQLYGESVGTLGAAGDAHGGLVDLDHLRVVIPTNRGEVQAVRDVSFRMAPRERLAILGESGSGKTMTVMTLLGLQPERAVVQGHATFLGIPVDLADDTAVGRAVRPQASVVFQDSLSSLNPRRRVGVQLAEVRRLRGTDRRTAWAEATEVLGHMGVTDAAARMRSYPHQLSGGMRQRVMISMAVLARPALLIADEPTTALDTTVQAQVIDLLGRLQAETSMGLVMVTHDIALAAEVCDRAIVMYAGEVVEDVPMAELRRGPSHPYARALLRALPAMGVQRDQALETIEGEAPSGLARFAGCPFAARCPEVQPTCHTVAPMLQVAPTGHRVRCHRRVWDAAVGAFVANTPQVA